MISFIGDYTCKVDPKGRITLPTAFKRQMPAAAQDKFVIKKDIYEKCLVLYPIDEWDRQVQEIQANTNPNNREHSALVRGLFKDIAELEIDANNRVLIPARLLKVAEIDKDVVLAGLPGKIELWSKDLYEQATSAITDLGALASKILGGNKNNSSAP